MAKKEIKTKSQILAELAEVGGITKKQSAAIYERFLEIAYTGAKAKAGFVVPGLGKLIKKERKARTGRNPATGAEIKIPKKTVVKFTVAKACKEAVLAK